MFQQLRLIIVMLVISALFVTALPAVAQQQKADTVLRLTGALDEGLMKSPRAASARAILPVARSAYAQALTFPNPVFLYIENFKADQVRQIGPVIPMEPPWKVLFRLFATKQDVSQADKQVIQNLWLLRADIRRAYVDLVVAQELAFIQAALTKIFEQLVVIGEERHNAGDVALLEVEKARLARDQAAIQRDKQAQIVVYAKQKLSVIIGRELDSALEVPSLKEAIKESTKDQLLPDLNKEVSSLSSFVDQAMVSRPQIRVLKQALAANRAQQKNTLASIFPDAQLTFGPLKAKDIGPEATITRGYVIGASVELPVFNFQQGPLARLAALYKQLQADLQTQRNIAKDEVANAYRRLIINRQIIKTYQETVLARSDRVVQMTLDSYHYGQTDITAALVAAQLNIQTQTQYIQAISDYQQAITDLEQVIGMPLQ
jgi:cobalt-zinc-cadmium efflux system outer membrane protein